MVSWCRIGGGRKDEDIFFRLKKRTAFWLGWMNQGVGMGREVRGIGGLKELWIEKRSEVPGKTPEYRINLFPLRAENKK